MLSAFKTPEITDIPKHDTSQTVCLVLDVNGCTVCAKNRGLGLRSVFLLGLGFVAACSGISAASFKDVIHFLCCEHR